jgi:hypothetical protein
MAGVVFGASAAANLRSPAGYRLFRAAIAGTGLLPPCLLRSVTAALAAAEALTAAGLAASAVMMSAAAPGAVPLAQAALSAAVLLTAVLIADVAVVIRRGVPAPCA